MKNEVFYIRTTDGQEVETQGITNLPEISVAEDAPEWADDLQFVKLADAASFEATFQISEETIKALDEAMKNIARQITAAMAAASDICKAVVAVFREYEESTAPTEELFAEFEEMAKLAEVLNPEQLAARRSLYSAKTRHRAAAVARTGIIRATSRRFDGQALYLKQAKISKKLPRSDMTFHPALAGCAGTKQHRPRKTKQRRMAGMPTEEYVLSLSYGKDSMACIHVILDILHWPLDRIVTADLLPPFAGGTRSCRSLPLPMNSLNRETRRA